MTEIAGRVAVVTGGGSGIGKGLAVALARQGAAVMVADILVRNAQATVEAIAEIGGRAVAVHCDVCERDSLAMLRAETEAALGPASLIFANAGATSFQPLTEMSDDEVDWIIQVNLMGVLNTARTFLPGMIERRHGGHIMATASTAGLLPGWIQSHTPYSAAKAGIIGAMMNLSMELKQHEIYTTSYCPGGVATSMGKNNSLYRPARFGGPTNAQVHVGGESFKTPILFYQPEIVAPMVLRAVRNNRPFVFDHSEQRRIFRETYANVVEACFDDIEDYEHEFGRPKVEATVIK